MSNSEDEFNNDTFGDQAVYDMDKGFKFANPSSQSSPSTLFNPLDIDPAITMIRPARGGNNMFGVGSVPNVLEERPPGMSSPVSFNLGNSPPTSLNAMKKVMTLADIETQLSKVSLGTATGAQYFSIHSNKPTNISFPKINDVDDDTSASELCQADDPHRGTMSRYEREGISRMHLGQLTTEKPDIEDYYYKSYARRIATRRKTQNDAPLYLPLPTMYNARHRRQGGDGNKGGGASSASNHGTMSKINEELAGALGKRVTSSSKRPRQLLTVPSSAKILNFNSIEADVQYSLASSIEKIYEAVFNVEDALVPDSNADYDKELLYERRKEAISILQAEFLLKVSSDELSVNQQLLLRFLNLMAQPKAKKILGRALKAVDSIDLSEAVLSRLVNLFEYLDVCRIDAPEADINLFVNSILASLVPFVAKCSWESILTKIKLLADKSSLAWIVCNKAGLVLSCILLSRLEILKSMDENPPSDTKWPILIENLFDQLQDRLGDVFTNLVGIDSEFYGWQFMALLAINVDADRKRTMVMDLRERILLVVQGKNEKAIANLNIFLNALGLDASQLAIE